MSLERADRSVPGWIRPPVWPGLGASSWHGDRFTSGGPHTIADVDAHDTGRRQRQKGLR